MPDTDITVEDFKRHRDSLTDLGKIKEQEMYGIDFKIKEIKNQIEHTQKCHEQRMNRLRETLQVFENMSVEIDNSLKLLRNRHIQLKALDEEQLPELKPVSRSEPPKINDSTVVDEEQLLKEITEE